MTTIAFVLTMPRDPDVLIFAWCGAGDRVPMARVIKQRGWQSLRAVTDGRVYCIPDEFLNTPAHPLSGGSGLSRRRDTSKSLSLASSTHFASDSQNHP